MLGLQVHVAMCLEFYMCFGDPDSSRCAHTTVTLLIQASSQTIYQLLKGNVFDSTVYLSPKMSIKLEESHERNGTREQHRVRKPKVKAKFIHYLVYILRS